MWCSQEKERMSSVYLFCPRLSCQAMTHWIVTVFACSLPSGLGAPWGQGLGVPMCILTPAQEMLPKLRLRGCTHSLSSQSLKSAQADRQGTASESQHQSDENPEHPGNSWRAWEALLEGAHAWADSYRTHRGGGGGVTINERMDEGTERPAKEGQLTWFSLAEVWLSAVSGHLFIWRVLHGPWRCWPVWMVLWLGSSQCGSRFCCCCSVT